MCGDISLGLVCVVMSVWDLCVCGDVGLGSVFV